MFKLDKMKISKTCFAAVIYSIVCMTGSFTQDLDEPNTLGNSTSSNQTASTTTDRPVTTTAPDTSSHVKPDIVITDQNHRTCLLATFNLDLSIDYSATDTENNETYVDIADVELPLAGSKASGNCSSNQSTLAVSWGESAVKIVMVFTMKKNVTDFWAVTSLSLQYDTSNTTLFPNAKSQGIQNIEDSNMTLFLTPLNQSYTCAVGKDVEISQDDRVATVSFSDLQLQAFGIKGTKFAEGAICSADFEASKMEKVEVIIPLVVAGCLTIIVLVVIVGYIVSRQTNLSMSGYRSMD
ncbi:hypothetical protein ScPMuIL_014267 [Solemya velum]